MAVYIMNACVFRNGIASSKTVSFDVWKEKFLEESIVVDPQNGAHRRAFTSTVGYPQVAKLLTEQLGIEVRVSREQVDLREGDTAYVVQLPYRIAAPKTKGDDRGNKIEDYIFSIMKKLVDF